MPRGPRVSQVMAEGWRRVGRKKRALLADWVWNRSQGARGPGVTPERPLPATAAALEQSGVSVCPHCRVGKQISLESVF